MKKRITSRIISLIVCAALLAGMLALTGCGLFRKPVPTTYPYVFVHGLNGFGDDSRIPASYWGATAGALLPELEKEGFPRCYAPSVGAMGSAWDNACELYAQLMGGTVDYGAAHSAAHSHERFGAEYAQPLFPGWGEKDEDGNLVKANLIAHSFGGATARVLAGLLADGSQAEREAAPEDCSPLFAGGKGDWIFSVTALASPHNGVSILAIVDINPGLSQLAGLLGSSAEILESVLGQFGVSSDIGSLEHILQSAKTMDTAYYDLSIPGAEKVNEALRPYKDSYYFSYPIDGTKDGLTGRVADTGDMTAKLRLPARLIGANTIKGKTAGSITFDDSWLPNDGLVNTISATAPFNEAHVDFDASALLSPADYEPGTWYVMPTVRGDHGTIIGLGRAMNETLPLYLEQLRRIDELSLYVTGKR
ncbi:MAG: hypothetical protein FWH26_02475 [Oscillospiraceae bacterium]|nr:hypothetical protein [Oscillospiraceae bacterium]